MALLYCCVPYPGYVPPIVPKQFLETFSAIFGPKMALEAIPGHLIFKFTFTGVGEGGMHPDCV